MAALFFIYGLAFFILGVTVAIYPKKHSKLWLAHNVWLIATFGILHGLNEWVDLLIIIQKPIEIPSLQIIRSFLLPGSFVLLLMFGLKCIIDLKNKSPILKAVPVIVLITWAIIVLNSNQRFLMADIWARYLLAVPGTLLTSFALIVQSNEIKKVGLSRPIIYLKVSALGFLFYGFFSGLVVPNDHFFPAAILNYTVVTETTGLQVQLFRTFCALVIAFGVIKVLSIFEWETIEALRISRDKIELEVKQRTHDLNATNAELEREITERKKLQDLIVSAKKEWEESFDVINEAITIHDKDFNILRANKSVTTMLGVSFREIIGQKCYQLYHGSPSPPEGCASCLALKTGKPTTIETFEPHLDKFLEIKAFPQAGENKQIVKLVHVIRDITERKQMEDALRAQAALLNLAHDAIIVRGTGDKITFWNQGAERTYGWTREEAMGRVTHELLKTRFPKSLGELTAEVAENGSWDGELIHTGKDGREIVVASRWAAQWDTSGRQVGILEIDRDITARKKAEEQIRTLNEQLNQQVLDLFAANKELDSFVYSVSHDLRAPLRTISGFIKMMVEDYAERLDDEGKEYLTRIYAGSEKMSNLINDLLSLSQISRQEVERVEFSISGKASSIINDLRETDPGRRVDIGIQQGLAALADPGLTGILLSNLLGNAWKFTSKTESARIEFGAFEQDGKTVYYVRDNGTGFDPNYEERLFAPFQRLHSDKEFGGMGIGLSIVERIVRRHGGRIWAEGDTGKGATFFFTLN